MFDNKQVEKRNEKDRVKVTNCYDCGNKLKLSEAKVDPNNDSDKRFFCLQHWKKRFGKKKKLIKRFK